MFVIVVLKMYFPKLKNDFKYLKLFLLQPSRVTTIPGLPYYYFYSFLHFCFAENTVFVIIKLFYETIYHYCVPLMGNLFLVKYIYVLSETNIGSN